MPEAPMTQKICTTLCFAMIVFASANFAEAALKLGTTFSDNMVVQRDQDVIVWGEANPNESVQVQFGTESATATADAAGHWKTSLKPLPLGGPYPFIVKAGSESIELKNVLSGDVFLCS